MTLTAQVGTSSTSPAESHYAVLRLLRRPGLTRTMLQEAAESLKKAIYLVPNEPRYLVSLADIHLRLVDIRSTISTLNVVLKINDQDKDLARRVASYLQTVGMMWADQGNLEAALGFLEDSVALDAGRWEFQMNRAVVAVLMKRFAVALDAINKVILMRSPPQAHDHVLRAKILAASGQHSNDEVIADVNAAEVLDPHHPEVLIRQLTLIREAEKLYNGAKACIEAKNLDGAMRLLGRAIKLTPRDAKLQFLSATCKRRRKQYSEAIADLDEASFLHFSALFGTMIRSELQQQQQEERSGEEKGKEEQEGEEENEGGEGEEGEGGARGRGKKPHLSEEAFRVVLQQTWIGARGKELEPHNDTDGIGGWKEPQHLAQMRKLLYNDMALDHVGKGEYVQAIALLDRVIDLDKIHSEADYRYYLNRGDCFRAMWDLESAMMDYNRAMLALKPNDNRWEVRTRASIVRYLAGSELFNKGRIYEARIAFSDAIDYWQVSTYFCAHGRASYLLGDISSALRDFSRAFQLDPDSSEARLLLGRFDVDGIRMSEITAKGEKRHGSGKKAEKTCKQPRPAMQPRPPILPAIS